jgi:hypothetical protein
MYALLLRMHRPPTVLALIGCHQGRPEKAPAHLQGKPERTPTPTPSLLCATHKEHISPGCPAGFCCFESSDSRIKRNRGRRQEFPQGIATRCRPLTPVQEYGITPAGKAMPSSDSKR